MEIAFRAALWLYEEPVGWHFVTLPRDLSDDLRAMREPRPGFGAIRVSVAIGKTRWETSIFPDSKSGSYVLPVKKSVRVAERLTEGDEVDVQLKVALP